MFGRSVECSYAEVSYLVIFLCQLGKCCILCMCADAQRRLVKDNMLTHQPLQVSLEQQHPACPTMGISQHNSYQPEFVIYTCVCKPGCQTISYFSQA